MKLLRPEELKHYDLTEKIIGEYYAVYNELGSGFLKSVYKEALAIGLRDTGLKIVRQVPLQVWFP